MERSIGATDLRQRLTDVLQAVREQGETYIVETFGRPQVAIINLDEYQRIQRFRRERSVLRVAGVHCRPQRRAKCGPER